MSVESLLSSRAEEIIVKTKFNEEIDGIAKSPVFIIASAFWREGRNELRRLSAILRRDEITFNPYVSNLGQLPRPYRDAARFNYASCVFGLSLIFIERALVERSVNLKHLAFGYNIVTKGTVIPPLKDPGEAIEKLSDKEYKDLLAIVDIKHPDNSNRSLSRLYTDKINLMPNSIRKLLEDANVLNIIRNSFLQKYNWYVTDLISYNARTKSI